MFTENLGSLRAHVSCASQGGAGAQQSDGGRGAGGDPGPRCSGARLRGPGAGSPAGITAARWGLGFSTPPLAPGRAPDHPGMRRGYVQAGPAGANMRQTDTRRGDGRPDSLSLSLARSPLLPAALLSPPPSSSVVSFSPCSISPLLPSPDLLYSPLFSSLPLLSFPLLISLILLSPSPLSSLPLLISLILLSSPPPPLLPPPSPLLAQSLLTPSPSPSLS